MSIKKKKINSRNNIRLIDWLIDWLIDNSRAFVKFIWKRIQYIIFFYLSFIYYRSNKKVVYHSSVYFIFDMGRLLRLPTQNVIKGTKD